MDLRFDEYQCAAERTAIYPHARERHIEGLIYTVLGLVGEAGELANRFKKVLRDDEGILAFDTKKLLLKELGDCLWYCAMIASELDLNLSEVAQMNLDKLAVRVVKGTLGGSGDQR